MNHSCSNANVQVQRWFSKDGTLHLVFVTVKDILKGDQLLYDYEDDYFKIEVNKF